jgi:NADH:ubiquinone reductase (H+-translocating)
VGVQLSFSGDGRCGREVNFRKHVSRRVVIVGGGIGGWNVARLLEQQAERKQYEVTLIDRRPHHEFAPLYYEVATGISRMMNRSAPSLEDTRRRPLSAFSRLTAGTRMTYQCGDVVAIDRRTRRIRTREGDEIPYDVLVLALGSESAFFGISGLRTHALPLKSARDAYRIQRRFADLITRASDHPDQPSSVIVGGAGATGIEFVCELANTVRSLERKRVIPERVITATIIEASSRVLGVFPSRMSRVAVQRMHQLGVRVLLDTMIKEVRLGSVIVAPRPLRDGEDRSTLLCGFEGSSCTIDSDMVVWTGGIRYPSLPQEFGFRVDQRGRVIVDDQLLVEGETCVFALGDCAALTHATHGTLPPLASVAVRQAPTVAQNVIACLEGTSLRWHRHRTLPSIVPLGGKRAAVAYQGRTWVGFFPWAFRVLVDGKYFMQAFGFRKGVVAWFRSARMIVQND